MTNEQRAQLENLVFSMPNPYLSLDARLQPFLDLIAAIEAAARRDATADAVRSFMEIAAEIEHRAS